MKMIVACMKHVKIEKKILVGEPWFHCKGRGMAFDEETQSFRLDWSWIMVDFSDSHI